ncbi:hypothetical protein VPNG_03824 [Cytospora leucostoma]|uniref:Carbohydrate kinase PfkB domain-containing protein n=1 Tax=Cytospora leucostoma TaxID=1230097 RepID=A0A423XFL4_9PEZI|nr:hypothetical protein VPNG_03824 [Cytospora leucostoma]
MAPQLRSPSPLSRTVKVVGSLNWDIVVGTDSNFDLNTHGEHEEWMRCPGDHGGNQAVAIYRASRDQPQAETNGGLGPEVRNTRRPSIVQDLSNNVEVHMIGMIGDKFHDEDERGKRIKDRLEEIGINVDGISVADGTRTGYAHVYVDPRGVPRVSTEGSVTANTKLLWEVVEKPLKQGPKPRLILVQLETPLDTALETIKYANDEGIPVIFNAAPVNKRNTGLRLWHLFKKEHLSFDHVILNRDCADRLASPSQLSNSQFLEEPTENLSKRYQQLARDLHKQGASCVVITMGHRGVIASYLEPTDVKGQRTRNVWHFGAKVGCSQTGPNPVVDQTGASDAFIGAYAVEILRQYGAEHQREPKSVHLDIGVALEMGVRAGGLAVGKKGSMDSIPWRDEIEGSVFAAAEGFQFD